MSKVLLPGEFDQLLEGAADLLPTRTRERDTRALILIYDLALRIHEACDLRWEQFDGGFQVVTIDGKGSRWRDGKKRCRLPVSERLAQELARGGAGARGGHVLTTSRGNPVAPQHYRRMLAWLGPAAIGKHVYPHMLRHTRITDLGIDSQKPLRAVQEFARHDSLATTEMYLHLRENWMDELRDAL